MTPAALIIPAAGLGSRLGRRKCLVALAGRPLILHTLECFLPLRDRFCQAIVVAHADDLAALEGELGAALRGRYGVSDIVPGGERRQDSVAAGLARVRPEAGLVAIHDAARPFVAPECIAAALDAAEALGAAIVATPMKPTVKRVAASFAAQPPARPFAPAQGRPAGGYSKDEGRGTRTRTSGESHPHPALSLKGRGVIVETVDRRDLWCAQTPQVFRRELIVEAYAAAERDGVDATDDAQLVERLGRPVAVVPGSELNLKITTPEDLRLAEAIVASGLVRTAR